MSGALVAGLLAGYGIAVPVGAVGAYLVALSSRTPWRTGACAALGVATADGLYALIAVVGGRALAPAVRSAETPLRWASALVLLALAARTGVTAVARYRGRQPSGRADGPPSGPLHAYVTLLGITLLNPATVVYFTALVLGARASAAAATGPDEAVFVLAAFAASATWQLLLAGGGTVLGRFLAGSRGRLATALLSTALIAALAVRLLVTAP
ncbi:LysE family transporter [Streptomyces roseifaciens]|uniref:LysE family transporter n=1 Tax=Streptomyces roseifaciens TaxID=1488406 RepID=UPI0007181FF6|nr:LysE family transporter [Streptomyces roseifaciens]